MASVQLGDPPLVDEFDGEMRVVDPGGRGGDRAEVQDLLPGGRLAALGECAGLGEDIDFDHDARPAPQARGREARGCSGGASASRCDWAS